MQILPAILLLVELRQSHWPDLEEQKSIPPAQSFLFPLPAATTHAAIGREKQLKTLHV